MMAILGIGVDICSIERMSSAISKAAFVTRVFSECEIEYAEKKSDSAIHYAACFAAKEALAKAGGWGLGTMGLKSCRVLRISGAPQFAFSDKLNEKMKKAGIKQVHLSLSHDGGFAVAMVVLEG